jgi:hypothetical protein
LPLFVCFRGFFFGLPGSDVMLVFGWYRFQRGLKRKPLALIKKLRKAVSLLHLAFRFHSLLVCSDLD